MLRYTCKI